MIQHNPTTPPLHTKTFPDLTMPLPIFTLSQHNLE